METNKTDQRGNSHPDSDNNTGKADETSKPLQETFEEQQGIYKNSDGLGIAGQEPQKKDDAEQEKA